MKPEPLPSTDPSPDPFTPGPSVFRVKGLTFTAMRDYVDANVPGGLPSVLEHVPPERRDFCSQIFIAVGWYDALPIAVLSRAIADAEGRPYEATVRARARWVATRDATTIHRLLLRVLSPGLVVERLPRLALRYFDFGRAVTEVTGPGRFEGVVSGIPRSLVAWFVPMLEGYIPTVLSMAGARDVALEFEPPATDGARRGLPTVTLRFRVTWR